MERVNLYYTNHREDVVFIVSMCSISLIRKLSMYYGENDTIAVILASGPAILLKRSTKTLRVQ